MIDTSWIEEIDRKDAEGKLEEIYIEIEKRRGKIANIMKVHSLNPESMKAHMDIYTTLMFGKSGLSREEREMIAVAVSAANGCDYCINHHAEALNNYWKDEKKLKDFIESKLEMPERKQRMTEYAIKLTKRPRAMEEGDILILRECGFSDRDILDINMIASYFNFVNRIALGLGVEFSSEEVTGYNV